MRFRLCLLLVWAAACQPAPLGSANTPANPAAACVDSSKIDPNGICTMEYDPVCGCNKRTYPNACAARKAGVLTFTAGACPSRP